MAWQVVYIVRGHGEVGEEVADEAAADAKIAAATNSQNPYADVRNIKIRREDIIMIRKEEKPAP